MACCFPAVGRGRRQHPQSCPPFGGQLHPESKTAAEGRADTPGPQVNPGGRGLCCPRGRHKHRAEWRVTGVSQRLHMCPSSGQHKEDTRVRKRLDTDGARQPGAPCRRAASRRPRLEGSRIGSRAELRSLGGWGGRGSLCAPANMPDPMWLALVRPYHQPWEARAAANRTCTCQLVLGPHLSRDGRSLSNPHFHLGERTCILRHSLDTCSGGGSGVAATPGG